MPPHSQGMGARPAIFKSGSRMKLWTFAWIRGSHFPRFKNARRELDLHHITRSNASLPQNRIRRICKSRFEQQTLPPDLGPVGLSPFLRAAHEIERPPRRQRCIDSEIVRGWRWIVAFILGLPAA